MLHWDLMKRFFFSVLFFLLFLIAALALPKPVDAECFRIADPGYGPCVQAFAMGTAGISLCCDQGGDSVECGAQSPLPRFGCCNDNFPCSMLPVNPGAPTPTPDVSNPDCGGTSQPCCPGNACDTADLNCISTMAGDRCLGIGQICCLPGGRPAGYDCSGVTCGGSAGAQNIFCNPSSGARSTSPDAGGIYTAIGCIPVESTQEFVGFLLRWCMGIAGGVAFILIIYAGFMVITSAGNPQKLQAGKELLTAAITGLLLLVFGAFILEFIGVDILNIPGFGG